MSKANNTNGGTENDNRRVIEAVRDRLGPGESLRGLSNDRVLETLGEITDGKDVIQHEELEALVAAKVADGYGQSSADAMIDAASGTGTTFPTGTPSGGVGGDHHDLDAYGTGIAGDTGETPELPADTRAVIEANQDRSSGHDLDAYGTGVDATESLELPAETRAALQEATERPTDPDAYGTGVAGDASVEEYRRRDEQAEIWARAIEKAEDRNSDDDE